MTRMLFFRAVLAFLPLPAVVGGLVPWALPKEFTEGAQLVRPWAAGIRKPIGPLLRTPVRIAAKWDRWQKSRYIYPEAP
jgi:hypothetical protein